MLRGLRVPHRPALLLVLLALATFVASFGARGGEAAGGSGSELRPLDARLGQGVILRGLFRGDELVYAFVADPAHRVMTMKDPPPAPPAGLLYCFGVEDGLYLDGQPLARPAECALFALHADGNTAPIELTAAERKELERQFRHVRGPMEDEALAAKLRAALGLTPTGE